MERIEKGYVFLTNGGCKAKVIDYVSSKNVRIQFLDEYGYQTITSTTHIKSGAVKNPYQPKVAGVGFVGVGKHIASVGTKSTEEYLLWKSMIYRCYDSNFHERQPTYKDCTVCDEWHNFQNFAEWLSKQKFYKKGYELDKDLLFKDNKVYSPKTCRFVPKKINVILNDCESSRGEFPVGVFFSKNENKFVSAIRINGKKKHLGYFASPQLAHKAYVEAKENYVKEEAEKYRNEMDSDVYGALINWSVQSK